MTNEKHHTKILITGGTGDVGKEIVKELADKYQLRCLTRKKINESSYVQGDMNDYRSLLAATKGIDIVVHLAGASGHNEILLEEVNVKGTKNLVKACEENGVKKILFISSLDVIFNSPYGTSKKKAEEAIKKSSLNYLILRPAVIYGKYFTKDIMMVANLVKKSPVIPVAGSGENKYQPLYVRDLAGITRYVIDNDKFINQSYFIAGPETVSMNQLIDLAGSLFGKKVLKIHIPLFCFKILNGLLKIAGMNIDINSFYVDKACDINPIVRELNFKPTGLKEGLGKSLGV